MRLLCASPYTLLLLLVSTHSSGAQPAEITDLDLTNFDTYLAEHETVLVHFWAPCAHGPRPNSLALPFRTLALLPGAGSKKCEAFRPQMEKIAAVSEFAASDTMKHARSDISDKRGYTSYLEKFGVVRLPTIVLFRNSHPEMYSHEASLDHDSIVGWLKVQLATPALPRGADDISETHFFEQQLQSHEQQIKVKEEEREQEKLSTVSEEEKQRRRDFLHPGKADAEDTPPALDSLPAPDASSTVKLSSAAVELDEEGRRLEAPELRPPGPPPSTLGAEKSGGGGVAAGGSAACAAFEAAVQPVADADFEGVVLDKEHDALVLFYKPHARFCDTNATAYAAYDVPQPTIKRLRMDVSVHKSPFVFEESELPVLMLFPAMDKRPLEYNEVFDEEKLQAFVAEHCSTLPKEEGAAAEATEDKAEL